MSESTDNESWIVNVGGDVVEKRDKVGHDALSPKEQLIYWLWWADYMMQNAGDFANAVVLDRDFRKEAVALAKQLRLPYVEETFSLSLRKLERSYFERLDRVCNEIRSA